MTDKVYLAFVILILALVGTGIYVNMVFNERINACQYKGGVYVKAAEGHVCISKEAVL